VTFTPTQPAVMPRALEQGEFGRGRTHRWRYRGDVMRARPGSDLLTQVLAARQFEDPIAAERFLTPKLTYLHEPSLIPDLDKAARRIIEAIDRCEPIAIYGDYDVDGVTASAILFHTLHHLAGLRHKELDVRMYVPHRIDEGYGLNAKALRELAHAGAKVIISVDCGITAVEPVAACSDLDVDIIITDHHHPPQSVQELPKAYAVVHPRRPDSKYPECELSGAGVAYKLAWRLCTLHAGADVNPAAKVPASTRELLVNLLAFAALGAIADVMPLGGPDGIGDENRIFTTFGLTRIRSSPFTGLQTLCDVSRLSDAKVSSWDVGFRLAPRLNASGRMAHAKDAVELFTTASPTRAQEIAEALEAANTQRRTVEQRIVEQAINMVIEQGMDQPDHRVIVLAHPDWHAGVVGICCSRLVERFCRPVILMQVDGDGLHAHGSARSINGFDLLAGITACGHHLTKFGGHAMAAGCKLAVENLPAFTRDLVAYANAHITDEMMIPQHRFDAVLPCVSHLTTQAIQSIQKLAPFGRGNPHVSVMLLRATLAADARLFGKDASHAELLLQGPNSTRALPVTAWRLGQDQAAMATLRRGVMIDCLIEPKLDTYRQASGTPAADLLDYRLASK
jgi:single-stranded-DNA-specific exonuclease